MSSRTAEIKLTVDLDADSVPTRIEWQASEGTEDGPVPCRAMLLSVWDANRQATASIDLWTREITVDEMNRHFYEAFVSMAKTYRRATQNAETARLIEEFGERFGASTGIR